MLLDALLVIPVMAYFLFAQGLDPFARLLGIPISAMLFLLGIGIQLKYQNK